MSNSPSTTSAVRLLTLLAFLSGCCALAYEILYMRALTTLLGDMLYVHAALLSTFLIGIALGAKLAHRFVRWLWALEVVTGIYALALPPFLRWLAELPTMASVTSSPSSTILVTIALLSIPGLLIGFSIPLFSAYIKHRESTELAFQGTYAAYNLGALSSILVVEFLLVRQLGVTWSLVLIGAINLINGVVLWRMQAAPERLPDEERHRFPRRVVIALFIASLCSAAFQMFFLKLTYLVFGPARENFAIALSVTMFGIFAGAWLAARSRLTFASLLITVPLWIGLVYAAFVPIVVLQDASIGWAWSSELGVLAHKFFFGGLFAVGPMIVFGATLPALMRQEREVAAESGHLLWVSSLANAVGYLTYVLLGHPFVSTSVLLLLIGVACLFAAALSVDFKLTRQQLGLAGLGVVALVAMLLVWSEKHFYLARWIGALGEESVVEVFKSGAESATLVNEGNHSWVSYNGHPSIEVQTDGVVNIAETLSGVVPALGAPRLERALVLGLGTGITGGTTATLFDRTDIVEINEAFLEMAAELGHANLDVTRNPAATIHLADGRSFLVGKENEYDAIINSIPVPTYYSASKIYTVEFYDRVKRALKPDGVFCLWLSSWNMSEQGLTTVLSALNKSFSRCDLRVLSRTYYMATCSAEPIEPRPFRELAPTLGLVDQLQSGLPEFDLTAFFEDTRISPNIFDHFTPEVPEENTDDHPVLEFMVVRNEQLGRLGEDPFIHQQELLNVDPLRRGELESPLALVERAATFYFLETDQFRRNFLPELRADPEAWALWRGAGLGEDPNR